MSSLVAGRPVLRWAGGKRRLINQLIGLLPRAWENYVEPMAGGAALFFYLAPQKALLADINPDLINFYRVLKTDTSTLVRRLTSLRASRDLYYKMRSRTPKSKLERAVRFAYLNRLCWNGLHRVNQNGDFNVPIGDRLPEELWDPEELYQAAKLLQSARLLNADFETTLGTLRKGDFAFIDPPYPRGARAGFGFNRYSPSFFSLEHHKRLGRRVRISDQKGSTLMITLSQFPELLQCYPQSFVRTVLNSKSLISSKLSSRCSVNEVVLTNYP